MQLKDYIRKVNYYETDLMAIVHHSNYIRWFEEARCDFLEQIGFPLLSTASHDIQFAVLNVNCDYRAMTRFGETVRIHTVLKDLKHTVMSFEYTVRELQSGELRAVGTSRHCFYSLSKKTPAALKKALPELYDLFQKHLASGES